MSIIKIITVGLIVFLFGQLLFSNGHLLKDPNEALVYEVASESYYEWRIDFLLWRGASPTHDNGAVYRMMMQFHHYDLIEKLALHVPREQKEKVLKLVMDYEVSLEIRGRLISSLKERE